MVKMLAVYARAFAVVSTGGSALVGDLKKMPKQTNLECLARELCTCPQRLRGLCIVYMAAEYNLIKVG